jgi:hypothetical protein
MNEAINAYYTITASSEFRERERLWEKARHDEAQALRHARLEGREEERTKWQGVVKGMEQEREKWQGVVAENARLLADKDAEIARLRAEIKRK